MTAFPQRSHSRPARSVTRLVAIIAAMVVPVLSTFVLQGNVLFFGFPIVGLVTYVFATGSPSSLADVVRLIVAGLVAAIALGVGFLGMVLFGRLLFSLTDSFAFFWSLLSMGVVAGGVMFLPLPRLRHHRVRIFELPAIVTHFVTWLCLANLTVISMNTRALTGEMVWVIAAIAMVPLLISAIVLWWHRVDGASGRVA